MTILAICAPNGSVGIRAESVNNAGSNRLTDSQGVVFMPAKLIRVLSILLAASLSLAVFGCGSAPKAEPNEQKPASDGSKDAYWAAHEQAGAVMEEKADDAVLISAGSQDASLTSNPQVWAFVYLSPSTKQAWRVSVKKGKALSPENIGTSPIKLDLDKAMGEKDVQVSAIEAIELARAKAKAEGDVPPNVIVGGIFVPVEGGSTAIMQQGVWNVTFVEDGGTKATSFNVSMTSGVATPAK